MGQIADYLPRALGVKMPEDYADFMETYGKRLSEVVIGYIVIKTIV